MLKTNRQVFTNFIVSSSILVETNKLIERLSFEGRQAYFVRDYARLRIAGEKLIELSPRSEHIGRWFVLLANRELWAANSPKLIFEFETLAEKSPLQIRAAAMSSMAALEINIGRTDKATMNQIIESSAISLKTGDLMNFYQTQHQLSFLLSNNGNHKESLRILKGLWPAVGKLSSLYSTISADYHNSLAWELLQVGQWEAAKGFALLVAKSPYLSSYPEWQDTIKNCFAKQAPQPGSTFTAPSPTAKVLKFKFRTPMIEQETRQALYLARGSDLFLFEECSADDLAAIKALMKSRKNAKSKRDKNSK